MAEEGQELRALVDGEDHGDAGLFTDLLVVFTVGRGLVDDAGAVGGGDIVGHEETPAVLGAVLLGVGEVIPERLVRQALEFRAEVPGDDGGLGRGGTLGATAVAKVLGVGAQEVGGEQEGSDNGGLVGGRLDPVRSGGQHHVSDGGSDGERQVGGQGPGRGGPGERLDTGELLRELRLPRRDREGHGDGLVLAVLVDVVVHPQLVVGERRLVLPAVRQDPVAVVGQALLVQLLEGPEHGLHVFDVERLIVVLEVHPAGLAGDVALPLVGVLHHRGTAGIVELVDAHGLDLGLVRHAQLLHRLELGGQAVGVPAEAALDAAAALGLVAAHQVLGIPGQQVAVVREAVGERRAVVEDEFVGAVLTRIPLVDARLEGAVLVPVLEDALLDLRELHGGGHAGGVGSRAGGAGVGGCG